MKKEKTILVVDDEPDIVELLVYNLEQEGYNVISTTNGLEAVEIANKINPEVILMDLMMPIMDGIEACRKIRQNHRLEDCHIIFLTARAEEFSEIAAFESGASDYLVKPIKMRALLSRLAMHFNRNSNKISNENIVTIRDLSINKSSYLVTYKDNEIKLTKKEFGILLFLASNTNKVFNRDDILQKVWEEDSLVVSRTVDVHIRRIREKIAEEVIQTIQGVGYIIAA